MKLLFLWRGLLSKGLERRIAARRLADRVEVIDRRVDVNEILARVHATALLAERPDLVRPFPHSLLESLAAGKPVLLSRTLPMSDYVDRHACGVVVERHDLDDLLSALRRMKDGYATLSQAAERSSMAEFSPEHMVSSYRALYERALLRSPA